MGGLPARRGAAHTEPGSNGGPMFETRLSRLFRAALLASVSAVAAGDDPAAGGDTEPVEVGLEERARRRLVQLDVTVTGPRDVIAGLTARDFDLAVMGRPVVDFTVDRVCERAESAPETAEDRQDPDRVVSARPSEPLLPPRATNYLFYFDQAHLNMTGRMRSLELARDLVKLLVDEDDRATIVSSGEEVATFAEATSDRARLLEALDAVEGDRKQWDMWPQLEDTRVQEIMEARGTYTGAAAVSEAAAMRLARRYQFEDTWRSNKALQRFSMVLGRFADLDPPNIVLYFADTMRMRSGEHYLYLFGDRTKYEHLPKISGPQTRMTMDSFSGMNAYDRVLREAAALGVRLYTVQAEGLTTLTTSRPAQSSSHMDQRGMTHPLPRGRRISDAQDSLSGFALETGGRAFLNGVGARRIAGAVRDDLSCFYLLSFDPEGLPEDEPLRVLLRATVPRVKVHTRGLLVLPSESSRLNSRLLAAFATPAAVRSEATLQGAVVPTDYSDGEYLALVQIAAPPSPRARAEWDVGASLVSLGRVAKEVSGRITVNRPGVPVVLETEMRFRPGPYELVMVAHDRTGDEIVTGRMEGVWPDPDKEAASVGHVALLQPAEVAISREGETRSGGSLGRGEGQSLQSDLPTAAVSLTCRDGKKGAANLLVERRLVGETAVEFEPIELARGDNRCAQIRDMIPADTMTAGRFVYEIRVRGGEEELASASREFFVAAAGTPSETVSTPASE
jgi:VWFA-related protein